MTTSGVDGIGGVGDGGPDDKKLDRAAGADDSGKADGVDGTGKADGVDGTGKADGVDGSGKADGVDGSGLVDDFEPVDDGIKQHAWLMGQIRKLSDQPVSPGRELERIQDGGFSRADEARLQQLVDRLLEESL